MELDDIKKHWNSNAKKNSTSLMSTTKTSTIKKLEIENISRVLNNLVKNIGKKNLLEVGCGNGYNLFGLEERFPGLNLFGVDYSNEMIEAAQILKNERANSNIQFSVADALAIPDHCITELTYDFVLTNRMLINLNSWELQQKVLKNLISVLKPDGYLITIENFSSAYENQNKLRELIGLPPRVPDTYNKFLNENEFEEFVREELGLKIIDSKNFGSLHDILLYVLLPKLNSGVVDYKDPLMEEVTTLLTNAPDEIGRSFGYFGQNNLYVMKRA